MCSLWRQTISQFIVHGNLNSLFMVTPFTNVAGNPNKKSQDNYNYFHSQLRIRVECAFGMLAARWGCLRMALHHSITVTKVIALVNMLVHLHNFCLEANRATEQDKFDIDRDVVLVSWITTNNV